MEFNEQQQAAIQCSARHVLVLAGAGTGKTRTIIGRAGHLVGQGCLSHRIAIITFTRRAAGEIRHRLIACSGEDCRHVVSGTFHSFCLRAMTAHPKWFGLTGSSIIDRDDQSQLMKLVRGQLTGGKASGKVRGTKKEESLVPQASQLINYYSYARNTNQPIRDYLERFTNESEETIERILQIFAAYKKRKLDAGYLDFDDILHRFAKVMKQEADVCVRIARQFEHVLVDEMQDTNPLQWLILESLAPHVQLFCVGDDAQSIYAFRGADFRNVHSFQERLPESEILKLELNYRSTQEILDLSNWLLTQSRLEYNKKLQAHRGKGLRPILAEFDTDREEAEWVANQIVLHHQNGARWDEQMVLCRTSSAARNIESELIHHKIPYRFIGGIGLLQTAHVKDLLAVLRIVVNHRDELSWVRYLTMWPAIGEVTAARLIQQLRSSLQSSAAIERLAELRPNHDLLKPLQSALKLANSPAACIQGLAEILDDLMASRYANWDKRSRDFKLLLRLAEKHQSLKELLDTYTLDPISTSEAESKEADDILTLITVHSAKGTEVKVCYVVSAQHGNYPHLRSLSDPEAFEEERRILYVALTRAKDELLISRHTSVPFSYGRSSTEWKSVASAAGFLDQLPSKLVKLSSQVKPMRLSVHQADYWDDDPL